MEDCASESPGDMEAWALLLPGPSPRKPDSAPALIKANGNLWMHRMLPTTAATLPLPGNTQGGG